MRIFVILAAFALWLVQAGDAEAHRLNVFAYGDGTMIVGSAYFSGGGAPDGATVTAYGPDGTVLGETTTDAEGAFTIQATARVDHRIAVETADGHVAEFTVAAGELSDSLPAPEGAVDTPEPAAPQPAGNGAPTAQPAAIDEAALEALVTRTVRQQIQPLREELAALGTDIRVQDIIGGVGYILGLFGLAAYGMSLRRRQAAE